MLVPRSIHALATLVIPRYCQVIPMLVSTLFACYSPCCCPRNMLGLPCELPLYCPVSCHAIAMVLPCGCRGRAIAMLLPCYCHAIPLLFPCYSCHAIATLMLSSGGSSGYCHATAMPLACFCLLIAMPLPCHCHATAMLLPGCGQVGAAMVLAKLLSCTICFSPVGAQRKSTIIKAQTRDQPLAHLLPCDAARARSSAISARRTLEHF